MAKQTNKEIRSMNEGLPILYVEELEQRMETDPLAISNLFDQIANIGQEYASDCNHNHCNYTCEYTNCPNDGCSYNSCSYSCSYKS